MFRLFSLGVNSLPLFPCFPLVVLRGAILRMPHNCAVSGKGGAA